jgi:exopolysaccharide production protein ExoY
LADVLEPEVSGPIGEVVRLRPSAIVCDRPVQLAVKRGFDIVGSLVLILLVLPLALVVAFAIAVDSRGPILFVQRRVGRNDVEFSLLKFKTMVRDAEGALADHIASDEELLREWERSRKLRDDPRITRVGGFLRRFSVDELPQVVNVLRGDMSLVGPRPVTRDEMPYFGERVRQILSVRPGLTGLWAVSGRSNVSYEERIELELRYAVGWSLWMDAKILLRTIPAVLRGHGAY